MSVIGLILILLVLAVIAYFVNASSKLTPTWKWILNAVLITLALMLILVGFGVWDEVRNMKVPKI